MCTFKLALRTAFCLITEDWQITSSTEEKKLDDIPDIDGQNVKCLGSAYTNTHKL